MVYPTVEKAREIRDTELIEVVIDFEYSKIK